MTHCADVLRDLYYDMLRIRRAELKIEAQYHEDEMKTPIHLCIGQEGISAGVCANLRDTDRIFTTYRSHGQYLSKGGDLRRMIAELHCKETGCSRGRGGSMHLIDISAGHYGSSAIVGGALPIATGMALAALMQGEDFVTCVFFGDGATDQGVFYESVNYAMLRSLPIVYVYEDNQWAVCSHVSKRKAGECLYHHADPDKLFTARVDGNSVLEVFDVAQAAVHHARSGKGPALLECKTYRIRGHGGSGSDVHLGHRTAEEVAEWEARCPVASFRRYLEENDVISSDEFADMDAQIDTEIEEAFRFAHASPLPREEDALLDVYRL